LIESRENIKQADFADEVLNSNASNSVQNGFEVNVNGLSEFNMETTTNQTNLDFAASIEAVKDHGWYWGPLSGEAAEQILSNEPDGSFLVRGSVLLFFDKKF
jgi:hypothetical protein